MAIMGKIDNGNISIEKDSNTVITIDYSGRIVFFMNEGTTYRRSLDNRFLKISWQDGKRNLEFIDENEAKSVTNQAYSFLKAGLKEIDDDEIKSVAGAFPELNYDFLKSDAERMESIYAGAVPIIPPDQYFSIYLQVTRGCYWNRCTFCRLYKDRGYSIKNMPEFLKHLESVKEYFGNGIKSRRTVFLGDANAVNIDQKMLISILDTINNDLKLPVYSFIDAISTQKKKGEIEFEEMARHGMKRVYLGMESGSPDVLRLLNKLMNVSEAINMVNKIKSSGMDIGIIVMAGAGGKKYYSDHVESTASVISQMDLGKGDIIYISPIIEYEDAEYFKISGELGTLTDSEKEAQSESLKRSISETFSDMNGRDIGIPIVKYDLREAIY